MLHKGIKVNKITDKRSKSYFLHCDSGTVITTIYLYDAFLSQIRDRRHPSVPFHIRLCPNRHASLIIQSGICWRHGFPESLFGLSSRQWTGCPPVDSALFANRHRCHQRRRRHRGHSSWQVPVVCRKARLSHLLSDRSQRQQRPEWCSGGRIGHHFAQYDCNFDWHHQRVRSHRIRQRRSRHRHRWHDHDRCGAQFDLVGLQSHLRQLRYCHHLYSDPESTRPHRRHRRRGLR